MSVISKWNAGQFGVAGEEKEMGERRRSIIVAFNLGLVLVFGVAAVAGASWTTVRLGNLVFKTEGALFPKALPADEFAPSWFRTRGQIATADGSHPPALREGVVYIDKNSMFDAHGLPVCTAGQLEARDTAAARRVCGQAIIGSGQGGAEIAFPEQAPIQIESPITLFNGGVRGGTTTLFAHAFLTVPVPAAVVAVFKFHEVKAGRYGLRGIIDLPVIAGGSGSVTDFDFTLKRFYRYKGERKSYDLTKCPDGHINLKGSGVFRDEVRDGVDDGKETTISASLIVPCTPKR
jgi:hypothetical protein